MKKKASKKLGRKPALSAPASTARRRPGSRNVTRAGVAKAPATPAASLFDIEMMGRALELARSAGQAGEVPIGAVVYETTTGRVLGEGANTRETRRDPLGHAELAAIAQAATAIGDWRLNHCTLVVTLEPCPMCAGAIVNARVGRVVFGARDPKAGAIESLYRLADDARLNHRAQVIAGVATEECGALLREFFAALRSRKSRRATER